MIEEIALRHRHAVNAIRGWSACGTMGDGTEYQIFAPKFPTPIIDCLGQINSIMVWPNNAETILTRDAVALIDHHNAWHQWRFVRARIELVEPDYVIESAIMPNAKALDYLRRNRLGEWAPDGFGWKRSIDECDGSIIWHRTRSWELFDERSPSEAR